MTITVRYLAQIKLAAGTSMEQVDAAPGCTARRLVTLLGKERGGSLGPALLTSEGALRSSLLVFVGEQQVPAGEDTELRDGDELVILSPIAGG